MQLIPAHFALSASAFKIYCFLLMKMEESQGTTKSQMINLSKNRIHQFLKGSRNTLLAGLKELEEFRMIELLPNEPDKGENRIRIKSREEWNWELIRDRIQNGFKLKKRDEPPSLFDEE